MHLDPRDPWSRQDSTVFPACYGNHISLRRSSPPPDRKCILLLLSCAESRRSSPISSLDPRTTVQAGWCSSGRDLQELPNGFEPTLPQLFTAMEDILQSFDVVFISLDAIDESQFRRSLLGVLHILISSEGFFKIQLLATSREYADIQNTMQSISTPMSMANPGLPSDIKRHVMRVLAEERWLIFWTSTLKEEVQVALVTGAQGM